MQNGAKPCVKTTACAGGFGRKEKDKMILLRVDADDNPDLMKEKGISEIPYLELYKDGKRIWQTFWYHWRGWVIERNQFMKGWVQIVPQHIAGDIDRNMIWVFCLWW